MYIFNEQDVLIMFFDFDILLNIMNYFGII